MEMKKILLLIIIALLLHSCAFLFYNYQCVLETEFSVTNNSNDTTVRYQVGKLINRLSTKERFYRSYASATYDSLHFYGPDYHTFQFKIYEKNQITKVYLHYFGYNGFRSRPPHKIFIQSLTDSLKGKFGATQTIMKDISNEKKK